MTGTLTPLLMASVAHRKSLLLRIRMELVNPSLDSQRKVLMALAVIDRMIGESDVELARLGDSPPAVEVEVEVENEDGGYVDRDPPMTAEQNVKGDLGGFE